MVFLMLSVFCSLEIKELTHENHNFGSSLKGSELNVVEEFNGKCFPITVILGRNLSKEEKVFVSFSEKFYDYLRNMPDIAQDLLDNNFDRIFNKAHNMKLVDCILVKTSQGNPVSIISIKMGAPYKNFNFHEFWNSINISTFSMSLYFTIFQVIILILNNLYSESAI